MSAPVAHPGTEDGRWFLAAAAGAAVGIAAVVGVAGLALLVSAGIGVLFACYLVRHLMFAVSAMRSAEADLTAPLDGTFTPPVTVVVACKNEELVVTTLVDRLLALDYPADLLQLIVVDDDSDDRTGAILDDLAATHRQLTVLHRPPGSTGGKSGALNDAAELAVGDVLVIFDADHEPTAQTVRRLVRHFADPTCAAVMGRCVIKNRDDSLMSRMVWMEYLSGYLCDEYGRQAVFALPAYGGANCAVRASSLAEVGGYNEASVTEDTDLTLRLVLHGFRVRFDATAVDYEQAVPTLARYRKQRYRWARGHQQVWRDYWRAVLRTESLTRLEKIETLMFLWLYHVPVASFLSLLLLPVIVIGSGAGLPGWVFLVFPLFLLGPFLQIGAAFLLAGDARPRDVWLMFLLVPVVIAFCFTCARCWFDGVRGAGYTWAKTARTPS